MPPRDRAAYVASLRARIAVEERSENPSLAEIERLEAELAMYVNEPQTRRIETRA